MKASLRRNLWPTIMDSIISHREEEVQMGNYPSAIEKLLSCQLRCFWDRTDKVEEDFSELVLTFEHGNKIHEMMVDFIKKAGLWRGDEVRGSNKEFNISYRIDALIADPLNGGEIVPVELKSAKASSFKYLATEPFLSHYLQLQMYLHFHRPMPYNYGYVIYYNKNEDTTRSFLVEHDAEICEEVEKAIKSLEASIVSGNPPEPPESTEPCRWCQYKDRCFAEVKEDD